MTTAEKKKFYQMLGDRIRAVRIKGGLKQETFASFLKLSRASIVNIEKGRQHPPIHLLWVIAKVLNIEVTDILPKFSSSEKVSPAWKKLVTQQVKGDTEINKEKLISFIEELQSSKNI